LSLVRKEGISMKKEIFHYHELFHAVQVAGIFADGKTFPDCVPKRALEKINQDFLLEKEKKNFDLKSFVDVNFTPPMAYASTYESDTSKTVKQHIESLWDELTRKPEGERGSLIALPHPYIVPGGRFREIYYWDSYFTMLGLRVSGRTDMIRNMINNFSYLLDTIGYIPNGNRSYFLGRSQPPFFSSMVKLLDEADGHALTDYLSQLEGEYLFWMRGLETLSITSPAHDRVVRLPDGSILNRYWDANDTPRPESYQEDVELSHQSRQHANDLFRHIRAAAESGWDFSTRWFRDQKSFASIHTTEIIPVDLNCLLLHLEQTLSEAWQRAGNTQKVKEYLTLAESRSKAILKYCWDPDHDFFVDYDWVVQKQKDQLTLAGAFPLFFQVATSEQAERSAAVLKQKFLKQGGLVTTLELSGQQWDAPNGWAPLQWIAYQGLINYKLHDLANDVRDRWLALNESVYKTTGKMMEKYNVVEVATGGGGEYPNQDGFGWTNGVAAAMLKAR
jgi:alpha,alpha-trehalase